MVEPFRTAISVDSGGDGQTAIDMKLAEREGFEPPIRLPVCRISSAVLSTTQPPLQLAVNKSISRLLLGRETPDCYSFATIRKAASTAAAACPLAYWLRRACTSPPLWKFSSAPDVRCLLLAKLLARTDRRVSLFGKSLGKIARATRFELVTSSFGGPAGERQS